MKEHFVIKPVCRKWFTNFARLMLRPAPNPYRVSVAVYENPLRGESRAVGRIKGYENNRDTTIIITIPLKYTSVYLRYFQ